MADWFRSWHGAPTDPKWVLIARKAKTTPAVASAIAWALFDCASQATPRGNVEGFDCEVYAAWGGLDDEIVSAVVCAMAERGMIVGGILSSWAKRQPAREDGSAERAKQWREQKKTQENQTQTLANATERKRALDTDTDTDTDTEKKEDLGASPKSCPKRVRTSYPEDFEKFWNGYPTDQNMSKKEAASIWGRLPHEKREMALKSLSAFNAYCQSHPDYRPIHANRYLSKERFEGHVATAEKLTAQCFIEQGTPEWDAWQAYLKSTRGRGSPTGKGEVNGRLVDGWTFPTEYPPQINTKAERAA